MPIRHALRPYQVEIGRAILGSVLGRRGLTFSVEIARQGGKNELSAQMEVLLLTLFMERGGNLVKCSPTFKPQTLNSMMRLKERLDDAGYAGVWESEAGYIVRMGRARQMFFSADAQSHVVGATAHILLEVDESQDVSREKFYKEFAPMGAAGYAAVEWASFATNRANVGGPETWRNYLMWGQDRLSDFLKGLAKHGRKNAVRTRQLYRAYEPRASQTMDWGP